jgi:hypothetical protein
VKGKNDKFHEVRKELKMKNTETKSGFALARIIATTFINLLVVASFLLFGYFQGQSKHLVDTYLTALNSLNQGISISAIVRTVSLLF